MGESILKLLLAFLLIIPLILGAANSAALASETANPKNSDINFGEQQLELMLAARPSMVPLVRKGDPVWNWAARQLGGEATGSKYRWRNEPLQSAGYYPPPFAYHEVALKAETGCVSVRDKQEDGLPADPEKMWSAFIYELFNIRNDVYFDQIWQDARAGRITREEFVLRNAKVEYNAVKAMMHFYNHTWKPNAKSIGFITQPLAWWPTELPSTAEEWIDQHRVQNPGYFKRYEMDFDSLNPSKQKDEFSGDTH